MEKILLALDAHRFPDNTIDFACHIARFTHSKLTGLFLENANTKTVHYIPGSGDASYGDSDASDTTLSLFIDRFRRFCMRRQTLNDVHLDHGVPLDEVIGESHFADLLIVDQETSFSRNDRTIPPQFVKEVLLESECPVLVPPHDFNHLEKIIFIHKGKRGEGYQTSGLMEWLKTSYPQAEFVTLKEDPSDEIITRLIGKSNTLLLMA